MYDDVIDRLKAWFGERIEAAADRGVDREQIVIDPGLDFDIGVHDGLEVLRRLGELLELGRPLYVSCRARTCSVRSWPGPGRSGCRPKIARRRPPRRRRWRLAGGAPSFGFTTRSALQSMRIAGGIVG